MSDLAKSLRAKLQGVATISAFACHQCEHVSSDGTIKWLFDVGGGNAVESVYIPETIGNPLHFFAGWVCGRLPFCSTGHQGFSRNLTTGEIIARSGLLSIPCASAWGVPTASSAMW